MEVSIGQIVCSKAGRDSSKNFIVVEILEGNYVSISDGRIRRIENPKKKKMKHLVLTDKIDASIKEKITDNRKVSNSDIRKILAEFEDDTAKS